MVFFERCKICGRPNDFSFDVPDEVWARVVPAPYRNRVVCLSCFDYFASAKNIEYAKTIRQIHFNGRKAHLVIAVKKATDAVGG